MKVCWCRYKDILVSCSNDGSIRLWDKATADALRFAPLILLPVVPLNF